MAITTKRRANLGCLAKINHPDAGLAGIVVDKQQRGANELVVLSRKVSLLIVSCRYTER